MNLSMPRNANNLYQFCHILKRTETKYTIVDAEDLPDDCAYGIDILDETGKTKGFAGFWKGGKLNRIFFAEKNLQLGCFCDTPITLNMCSMIESSGFGTTPILEVWAKDPKESFETARIAAVGNFLAEWKTIKDETDERLFGKDVNSLYYSVVERGKHWHDDLMLKELGA